MALLACAGFDPAGMLHAMPPDAISPANAVDMTLTPAAPAIQEAPAEGERPPVYRYGLTFGGTALVSLVFEYEAHNRALELTLGTFSGRDVSLAVTGKQYVGGGSVRAFAGAGLWTVAAFPSDQRAGFALIARAPIGVDWHATEKHAAGVELNLNRALTMRRPDPLDERPPRTRIIPLPGAYYRYAR